MISKQGMQCHSLSLVALAKMPAPKRTTTAEKAITPDHIIVISKMLVKGMRKTFFFSNTPIIKGDDEALQALGVKFVVDCKNKVRETLLQEKKRNLKHRSMLATKDCTGTA